MKHLSEEQLKELFALVVESRDIRELEDHLYQAICEERRKSELSLLSEETEEPPVRDEHGNVQVFTRDLDNMRNAAQERFRAEYIKALEASMAKAKQLYR